MGMTRHEFMKDIKLVKEMNKAMRKYLSLKVSSCTEISYEHPANTVEEFIETWWAVQHECDMYEEGEGCNELTSRSYTGAKNWLEKYRELYNLTCEEYEENYINKLEDKTEITSYSC